MSDPHQVLRELLRELSDLCPASDLFLIGGLAVDFRIMGHGPSEGPQYLFTAADLRREIPRLVRVTGDLDLCVPDTHFESLDSNMRESGFQTLRSEAPPQSYGRGSVRVDVLSLPQDHKATTSTGYTELPELVMALQEEFELVPEFGPRVLVANAVGLLVLKCVAYDRRSAQRDSIDIARLALADRQSPEIRDALPSVVNRLPRDVPEAIRRTRQAFANQDGAAAGCLLTMLRSAPLGDDDWESEDVHREEVSAAVSELLSRP